MSVSPWRSPDIRKPTWKPVTCSHVHEEPRPLAKLVAYQRRPCGHRVAGAVVMCPAHGTLMRAPSTAERPSRCEECGEIGPLILDRITDITVSRYVGFARGIDFENRGVRDRWLQGWYQQRLGTLCRWNSVQAVPGVAPLETWERVPEVLQGRDGVAPNFRCTFSVVTSATEPTQ